MFNSSRRAAGLLFLLAGVFKLVFVRPEFAAFLAELHVPLPRLMAVVVSAIEICGGAALCLHRGTRLGVMRIWASLLAVDMLVAIATVGLPGLFGRSHHIGSHTVGTEPWRLPLEVGLFLVMMWICGTGIWGNGRVGKLRLNLKP